MGRTAAAEWKQMASPRTAAWSQCRVCSKGGPFRGGPEDHLGTPDAADPRSSSKNFSQHVALGRWLDAAVQLSAMWQSMGQCRTLLFLLLLTGFHARGPGADRTLCGFLEGLQLWFNLLPNLSQQTLSCLSSPLHTCRDGSQSGVPHSPSLPSWHEALRCGMELCIKCTLVP